MALGTLHNFEMHRGDTRTITGKVVDNLGVAVDLTGLTGTNISWVLANQDVSSTVPGPRGAALITKTIGSGITIPAPTTGDIEVDLASVDTTGRKPGEFYHELQVVLGGKTTTVLFGIITLRRDIVVPGP